MNCKECEKFINAFIDNELDVRTSLEVEEHIEVCDKCSRLYKNYLVLQKTIINAPLYYQAPEELKEKIIASLQASENKKQRFKAGFLNWRNAAAAFAFTTILLLVMLLVPGKNSTEEQIKEQIIDSHIRSLMAGHLTDVLSTDKHTVKPWFNGKLDFSPPVVDLSSEGFSLVGGRLDYIASRPVASLVYMRRKHYINLYIWYTENTEEINKKVSALRGYNLIEWNNAHKNYYAVSDLNLTELDEFVEKFKSELQ